ncbi:7-cyano-7-deazaguanine synthase QueC [Anaeroglobus geminatus]|uniref:7-cyano-7-deazaguanine synthase QueC n=1 Tax=Anaeroglobus geminatus TaxID=156456 RepID=UPI0002DF2D23|nr:7-cyano-7-deazaguanine synthase QueC [Anaeroglobus geminatus]
MKAAVLASGGVDSTTALAQAVERYGAAKVTAVSVLYGQKHIKELEAAEKIASYYGVEHISVDAAPLFQYSRASLLQGSPEPVPKECYADQLKKTQGKAPFSTCVPFRNGIFLAAAAGIALSLGSEAVIYGAHADDAAGAAYPDCSPAFFEAMAAAVWEGSGRQIRLEAPFLAMNKAAVVEIGLRLRVPYELTWSCYEGGAEPCGQCGTCRDRAAAFAANRVSDPAR